MHIRHWHLNHMNQMRWYITSIIAANIKLLRAHKTGKIGSYTFVVVMLTINVVSIDLKLLSSSILSQFITYVRAYICFCLSHFGWFNGTICVLLDQFELKRNHWRQWIRQYFLFRPRARVQLSVDTKPYVVQHK